MLIGKKQRLAAGVVRAVGVLFFMALVGFPFYWMVVSSLKPLQAMLLNPGGLWLSPAELTVDAYREVLVDHGIGGNIVNSVYVSAVTVVLCVLLATVGAYAVARLRFKGRAFMSYSILTIYMFPAIVMVIPLYVAFSRFGLRDSIHFLVPVYLAQTLPVALYMLKSYFTSVPAEIEDAGMVDGCSRAGVIWRITIPLSAPALATVALYAFMIAWNEFLFAFMFLDSPEKFTLSRGVVQIAGSVHLSKQLVMAASVLVTVPVLVLFLFFERHLVKGLTSGALKG